MKAWITDLFADTEGGASSKRVAFFIMILFYCGLSIAVVIHGVPADVIGFANSTLDKTKDIIQWLGVYILGDKAPAVVRALKGDKPQ
jgi:hypothetical protein